MTCRQSDYTENDIKSLHEVHPEGEGLKDRYLMLDRLDLYHLHSPPRSPPVQLVVTVGHSLLVLGWREFDLSHLGPSRPPVVILGRGVLDLVRNWSLRYLPMNLRR